VDEAIGLARRFGSDFGEPTVLTTTNGWYAVAAGPVAVSDVATFKKRLSDAWWAPKDTFLTNGQTFIQKVWESPQSPILASASSAEHRPRVASAAGLEVRIEPTKGRQVVRVRSGGRDVVSAAFNDDGPYNSTGASIARLDASSCPEYAKRHRDFPTALREHLTKNGYLVAGAAAEPATVVGVSPSFNCNKARTPSEIAICRLPGLAELDNILAAGYAFIKTNQGRAAADAIGIPYWRAIAHCEGVEECIANQQSEEIVALARAGAPVSLPASVSGPTNASQQEPSAAPALTQEPTPAPKPEHVASSGTGFFVTADGAVVTNAHVVEDCSAIHVTSDQGATAVAKVVARDARNDLAVLQSGLAARKAAAFRTSIRLGGAVEAFGYPLTEVLSKSGNFTLGNVSALVGLGEDSRYLQISAPVQPGNSGGPLLDQNGNLVGVVSAKLNALRLMVATNGDIAQNVNFAIKSSIVASFLEANGIGYATGAATQPMQPADLADQAKGISVYVECQ
jgi:S1-C subfamily serine protease